MEKFVLQWQWKETFPGNVPQLVSTEQNTTEEMRMSIVCVLKRCVRKFLKNLVCFCKSMEVLN